MKKQRLGLIGRNISYSFSKIYFEKKFNNLSIDTYSYDLWNVERAPQIKDLFNLPNLKGFNVTIPYKEQVISFLDELSEEAERIGAVNCVSIQKGKKIGYNTDAFGFEKTFLETDFQGKKALILGNGGAAKAVKFVLDKYKVPYQIVSRKSEVNFQNLSVDLVEKFKIIIQCTPVGTFPDVDSCLSFPFEAISKEHQVIDLIYNPTETKFLRECKKQGAKTINGQLMLEQQAEKSWEIWSKD